MAYKVFTNGSVLNASEINDNLMNQSVMVFSNSTTRAAALTSPVEGMLTWLEDVNRYENYNGTAWVTLGEQPGLVYIGQTSWSAVTTVSIDNVFSATYDNYKCFINLTSAATSAAGMRVRLRAGGVDLTANYELGEFSVGAGISQAQSIVNSISLGQVNAGSMDVNANGCELTLYNPFTADRTNITSLFTGGVISLTGTQVQNTNSYDGLTIFTSSGNFAGSLRVYGIRKS